MLRENEAVERDIRRNEKLIYGEGDDVPDPDEMQVRVLRGNVTINPEPKATEQVTPEPKAAPAQTSKPMSMLKQGLIAAALTAAGLGGLAAIYDTFRPAAVDGADTDTVLKIRPYTGEVPE